MVWWNQLSGFQQVMFVIAVAATLIMVIFLVLMIFGMDNSGDFDGATEVDMDGMDSFNDVPLGQFSGLRVLTLRGALAFLSIGAWVAFLFDPSIGPIWSSLIGVILGSVAAFLLAWAFRASLKLESVGNLNYQYAIGKHGNVYLRVPKERSGKGKVTLTVQERYVEVDAITDDEEDIPVRALVEVIGIENETTLIVKREKKE